MKCKQAEATYQVVTGSPDEGNQGKATMNDSNSELDCKTLASQTDFSDRSVMCHLT